MSIALLKEIGDLQREQQAIGEQFSKLYDARKQKTIEKAVSDFVDFFTTQGFDVNRTVSAKRIEASYGKFFVGMSVPDVKDDFFGAITVFSLDTSLLEKHQYTVAVRRKGSVISVSCGTVRAQTDEDEKERQEIEKLKKDIESLKNRVQSFNTEEWLYEVYEGKRNPNSVRNFTSMKELLDVLVK